MEPTTELAQHFHVLISDTEFTKKVKLSSIFNYFQEISNLHSDQLGIGIDTILEKYGVLWVLVKIRVDMERYPVRDEEVIVETWPHTPRKYEFDRDYTMKDSHGNIAARCNSTWVLLDAETRTLKKSDVLQTEYPEFRTERAIEETSSGRIRLSGEFEQVYKRRIGCSDIDMNGHLNNSKYVDFIMDCFTMEQLKRGQARSIQVNYMNEALPGDTLILYRQKSEENPDRICIKGIRESDGSNIFNATLDIEDV